MASADESSCRNPRVGAPRNALAALLAVALMALSCGGRPPTAPPVTPPVTPPVNTLPVIDSIVVQGTRPKEPPAFADLGENVPIAAKVHDDETPADQLDYQWSATAGAFTGSGASVVWQAPATGTAVTLTITLKVVEKYGIPGQAPAFQHDVTGTATLSLHDSIGEVGRMAREFLQEFSDTNNKNVDSIMRNFGGAGTCPDPSLVQDERDDVIRNYTYYRMINYRVDPPRVSVNFGASCSTVHGPRQSDACALVGVMWDSIDTRDNSRIPNAGDDQISASYATRDARWWLCSSDYDGHLASHPSVAFRYPR